MLLVLVNKNSFYVALRNKEVRLFGIFSIILQNNLSDGMNKSFTLLITFLNFVVHIYYHIHQSSKYLRHQTSPLTSRASCMIRRYDYYSSG